MPASYHLAMHEDERWVPVGSVGPGEVIDADLATGEGEREVVAWRTSEGEPCVMDARCPHQWSHLAAEGFVDGDEIVCTAHFWRFDRQGTGTKLNVKGRRDPKADIGVLTCRARDGVIEVLLEPSRSSGGESTT
jgi:nitrite reductase/ring-hydroxylating ferredoxin subunit